MCIRITIRVFTACIKVFYVWPISFNALQQLFSNRQVHKKVTFYFLIFFKFWLQHVTGLELSDSIFTVFWHLLHFTKKIIWIISRCCENNFKICFFLVGNLSHISRFTLSNSMTSSKQTSDKLCFRYRWMIRSMKLSVSVKTFWFCEATVLFRMSRLSKITNEIKIKKNSWQHK